jgi:hypothetical protein
VATKASTLCLQNLSSCWLLAALVMGNAVCFACVLDSRCVLQPWVESTTNATGHALGLDADVPWLKVTPVALRGVLNWITQRYGPVEIQVRAVPGLSHGMTGCGCHFICSHQ